MSHSDRKKLNLHNDGFSLLEVMIAIAIMSALMAGLMTFFVNMQKSSQYQQDKLTHLIMGQNLSDLISNFDECKNTLSGKVPHSLPPSGASVDIKDSSNQVFLSSSGVKSEIDNITINSIRLKNVNISAGDSTGLINLDIDASRKQSEGGPPEFKTLSITRRVLLNSSGAITGCANTKDDSLLVQKGQLGVIDIPANDYDEHELNSWTIDNRLATSASIDVSVFFGGVDIIWGHFRVYRNNQRVAFWTDGTAHDLGAAVTTSFSFIDHSTAPGSTTYRVTFQRLDHPSYGNLEMHAKVAGFKLRQ